MAVGAAAAAAAVAGLPAGIPAVSPSPASTAEQQRDDAMVAQVKIAASRAASSACKRFAATGHCADAVTSFC
jgi:hypothetical protein